VDPITVELKLGAVLKGINMKTMFGLLLSLLLACLLLAACGGTTENSSCIENSSVVCTCTGGATGVQTCTAAGIYTQCDCTSGVCIEGDTQACTCANDQTGTQTCDANGSWLPCQCEDGCLEGDTRVCATYNGEDCIQTCDVNGSFGVCDCSPDCQAGYEIQGGQCVDINECAENTANCHANATCENIEGGFTCTCDQYYVGDGVTCDFDECAAGHDNCDPNANCINLSTGFLCACKDGFEGNGESCTDVNECNLIPPPCPAHSQCQNDTGTFLCNCDEGYEWNMDTCDNIDECARELDDCSDYAWCADSDGGFACTCNEGYIGDGTTCSLDPDTYLADISDRPVIIDIADVGTFSVRALSRIGMDIEVIETPTTQGRTHKEPGLVSYPDFTMGGLAGSQEDANILAAWIDEGLASDPSSMMLTLEGLDGEQLILIFQGVKPVDGISTITQDGEDYVVSSITLTNVWAPNNGIDVYDYTEPSYPGCPQPGWRSEIQGIDNLSCWTMDGLSIPPLGSSEPVYLESVRNGGGVFNDWVQDFAEQWIDNNNVGRRVMSLIERDAYDEEVWRMNVFEIWPARINYFNPTKDYGSTYLVDLLIVNDWNEEG